MKTSTDFSLTNFFSFDRITAYYELTKPGITFSVLIAMAVGFILGSGASINYVLLLNATIGTWMIAAGTSAHNQFLEWRLDGQMKRTQRRPLPASKITPREGFIFSLSLIFAGLLYLIFVVNLTAGLVSLTTTLLYLCAYTPLKRISFANVFIGAIPGALPPVGGWVAASGHLGSLPMWILFAIVFFWQIPHVMAIAWVCKDDYQHAGFKMLPTNDTKGSKAAILILTCLLALLPTCWALYSIGMAHWLYLAGAMLSTLAFLYYGLLFTYNRNKETGKKLMFASFGYLPAVWAFIVADHLLF